MSELSDYKQHIEQPKIRALEKEIAALRELAFAPDGKEMRKALFEEAEKRGNAEAEVARLNALVERQRSALMLAKPLVDYLASSAARGSYETRDAINSALTSDHSTT